jgi:hypothetical protein
VGRVLARSKMGKFVRWDVIDGGLSWSFDQDKIAAEKLFDGCYIVSAELPKEKICGYGTLVHHQKREAPTGWVCLLAHPNAQLLHDAEAMLAVKAARTMLHYVDSKLQS